MHGQTDNRETGRGKIKNALAMKNVHAAAKMEKNAHVLMTIANVDAKKRKNVHVIIVKKKKNKNRSTSR